MVNILYKYERYSVDKKEKLIDFICFDYNGRDLVFFGYNIVNLWVWTLSNEGILKKESYQMKGF